MKFAQMYIKVYLINVNVQTICTEIGGMMIAKKQYTIP